MIVIGILMVLFIIGCVVNRGRVVSQSRKNEKIAIKMLTENWQNYAIYYSGVNVSQPLGILFDPIDDDKTITPDKFWNKVEDKKTLSEIIYWIER